MPDEILRVVAKEFKIDVWNLVQQRGGHRFARRIAIFSVSRFCRSRFPQTELATYFGLKLSSFATACRKVELAVMKNPELQDKIDANRRCLLENIIKTET